MNYNDLRSTISSSKSNYPMQAPSASFHTVPVLSRPYIPPTFSKLDFGTEKPRFLLISAVGASGKSALANKLSEDIGIPILDLGAHPPVADNTLTGLLTTSFALEHLSAILSGLRMGAYGVIIDGIDEGRSKVNEQAFNAFLDDLIRLSAGSDKTTFVLLGRTQALIDCWVYLEESGVPVGLASIDPFSKERAIEYIDTFSDPPASGQRALYESTRGLILSTLENAFSGPGSNYLGFIGYPPVLDAISTLLKIERSYFKVGEDLQGRSANEVEAGLLWKISSYLLVRERQDKIIPNVVVGLLEEFPTSLQDAIKSDAYSFEEQAARLIAYALKMPYKLEVIPQPALNQRYEDQVASFLGTHPFLVEGGREFRSAVFEAVCLAIMIASQKVSYVQLVDEYCRERKANLYLVQMLTQASAESRINSHLLHVLIGAALEYRSSELRTEVTVEPIEPVDDVIAPLPAGVLGVEIQIEITALNSEDTGKRFTFKSEIHTEDTILLGSRLSSCSIEMPCTVSLIGAEELEIVAPVEIMARRINLLSPTLVAKAQPKSTDRSITLEAHEISATLTSLPIEGGIDFSAQVDLVGGHHYPLVKYIRKRNDFPVMDSVRERYLKLRKILTHFRSHSRGSLAKLRAKVENERVAGNEAGRPVLDRLLQDGVLVPEGKFYFLHPGRVDQFLGVSYFGLRDGEVNEKLIAYLRSID